MARRKKNKHHEEEAGEAWLLPYSDLMTLLLALFIALFAVSQVDSEKAAEMAEAFQESMMTGGSGVLQDDGSTVIPLNPNGEDGDGDSQTVISTETETETEAETETETESTEEGSGTGLEGQELQDMELMKEKLDDIFEAQGVSASVTTYIDERGLVISLNNAILFDSGSAEIKPGNEDVLIKIATTIDTLHNYIRIEGHTDNIPISTATYPSNWELSCARAISVVNLFVESGDIDPEKLIPVGYGEYRPVADNSTEEGRAKNRRIDIIILSEKYNSLEGENTEIDTTQN